MQMCYFIAFLLNVFSVAFAYNSIIVTSFCELCKLYSFYNGSKV